MLETEQRYVDTLRSNLAKAGAGGGGSNNVATWQAELVGAERRVRTLQDELATITNNDQVRQVSHPPFPIILYLHSFIQIVLFF